jgi:hypothetical protein
MSEEKDLQFDDLAEVSGGWFEEYSRTENPDGTITLKLKDNGKKRNGPPRGSGGPGGHRGHGRGAEPRKCPEVDNKDPMRAVFEIFRSVDGTGKTVEFTYKIY